MGEEEGVRPGLTWPRQRGIAEVCVMHDERGCYARENKPANLAQPACFHKAPGNDLPSYRYVS